MQRMPPVPVFGYSVCEAEFLYVFVGPALLILI